MVFSCCRRTKGRETVTAARASSSLKCREEVARFWEEAAPCPWRHYLHIYLGLMEGVFQEWLVFCCFLHMLYKVPFQTPLLGRCSFCLQPLLLY